MRKTLSFVSAAVVIVVIFSTIYVVMQQSQRADANWPQIQMAEDAATLLNKNQPPRMFSGTYVDIESSLANFTNVYDASGQPITGSGYLDGSLATVPKGVLTAAAGQPYHAVTWEPKDGVRIAAVTVKANNYYVLSGRSLDEVEKNESKTFLYALIGGLLSLAVVSTYFVLITSKSARVTTIASDEKHAKKKVDEEKS